MILAGDFNINALDYEKNKKVQSFFNLMYRYNMILTINKPTTVGKTQQLLLTISQQIAY